MVKTRLYEYDLGMLDYASAVIEVLAEEMYFFEFQGTTLGYVITNPMSDVTVDLITMSYGEEGCRLVVRRARSRDFRQDLTLEKTSPELTAHLIRMFLKGE